MNSLLGVFFALALFVGVPTLVVMAIISTARGQRGQHPPLPSQEEPEQILRIRLARGEIDADEYERLRDLIRF